MHIFSLLAQNPQYMTLQNIPISYYFFYHPGNKTDKGIPLIVNGVVDDNFNF